MSTGPPTPSQLHQIAILSQKRQCHFDQDSVNLNMLLPQAAQFRLFFDPSVPVQNNLRSAGFHFICHLIPEEKKHLVRAEIKPRSSS